MNLKTSFLIGTLLIATDLSAEVPGVASGGSGYNMLLISLVSLIVVLLGVIALAANLLRLLAAAWKEKSRNRQSKNSLFIKTVLFLMLPLLMNIPAFAQPEEMHQNWDQGTISGIPVFDFYLIIGIIVFELLVLFVLLLAIKVLVRTLDDRPLKASIAKPVLKVSFWDRFNKVVPIEKEKDILLHHDYDGIQELDNSLPPWWKYGFYLTILISIIYLCRFHAGGNGPSSEQEYLAEIQLAKEAQEAYLAKSANNIDETNIKLLADETTLASGQKLFAAACVACHANDGGGGVGPNLTDDYWMHGGSIQDVFKSIKYGWQNNGMKSWKDELSPKQIADIACYIKHLRGTKPAAPKAPQGDLYEEPVQTTDTSATKIASK